MVSRDRKRFPEGMHKNGWYQKGFLQYRYLAFEGFLSNIAFPYHIRPNLSCGKVARVSYRMCGPSALLLWAARRTSVKSREIHH